MLMLMLVRLNRLFSLINRLTGTLKPHSNGPSYSNTVIGTLAVDGWAVTFGTARRGLARVQQLTGLTGLSIGPAMLDRSAVGQFSSLSSRTKWQRLLAGDTLRI